MKNTRENRLELWVILLWISWIILEILTSLSTVNKFLYTVLALHMITFFSLTCKKKSKVSQLLKFKAIQYSIIFMLALVAILFTIEAFTLYSWEINGFQLIFSGIAVQSIYFLFINSKSERKGFLTSQKK